MGRWDGGMQSQGDLLVMCGEQLDQWQSSASELKCGRLCMLADWSLALQCGPPRSVSVRPRPCHPCCFLALTSRFDMSRCATSQSTRR